MKKMKKIEIVTKIYSENVLYDPFDMSLNTFSEKSQMTDPIFAVCDGKRFALFIFKTLVHASDVNLSIHDIRKIIKVQLVRRIFKAIFIFLNIDDILLENCEWQY